MFRLLFASRRFCPWRSARSCGTVLRSSRRAGPADSAADSAFGVSSHVKSRRYTVVIADRTTGVVRRFTLSLRPTLTAIAVVLSPARPGRPWRALERAGRGQRAPDRRRRPAPGERELPRDDRRADRPGRQACRRPSADLSAKAVLDPESARALAKLPAAVRSRAMGGGRRRSPIASLGARPDAGIPGRHVRLAARRPRAARRAASQLAQYDLDRRAELLGATPSIWPAHGPLSATFGSARGSVRARRQRSAHRASTSPATADSRSSRRPTASSSSRGWNGDYGNMVIDQPRLRPRHPLRAPVDHARCGRATASSAGRSSARSARPGARPARTCTTNCWSTAS